MNALQNTALLVSYDGRPFHGWQRLRDKPTVQGSLEDAVEAVFGVREAAVGSGRTDRGAHARGQVASVLLPWDSAMEGAREDVVRRLNEHLQDELSGAIVIEDAEAVPADFSALHSCTGKTYRYALWLEEELPPEYERRVWHVHGKLDIEAMARATEIFEGEHDFATFASKTGFEKKNRDASAMAPTVRWLSQSSLFADASSSSPAVVELVFTGNGFLYKMVRNLVRGIVRVGEGRWTVDDLHAALVARDRKRAPGSAPASGLYLDEAYYNPPLFGADPPEGSEDSTP